MEPDGRDVLVEDEAIVGGNASGMLGHGEDKV